mgnify:CR=1 FL=1
MKMQQDLTKGNETKAMISFVIPMIVGNLFQQLYNVIDTVIVGKFIGSNALAAVGSSFSVMVLLTSIILGLCIGSGTVFSHLFGEKNIEKLKNSFFVSFCLIAFLSLVINIAALFFLNNILSFLQIPAEITYETHTYLRIIFYGITFTTIYNYFSAIMRSLGNSMIPLIFLIISTIINIVLDLVFVVGFDMGVAGAAYATIIAQGFSGIGIAVYSFKKMSIIRISGRHLRFDFNIVKLIVNHSILSSIQQSVMNLGILMVQGLVNSFGIVAMAAFATVVKIESFAYLPLQEFGNGFTTFIAQNLGAGKQNRITNGIRSALKIITGYGIGISTIILLFAKPLVGFFIKENEVEILRTGVQYLFIVSPFYCLIGYLFLFYGLYKGMGRPGISILLTGVSLGTRVVLAYLLSSIPSLGLRGIWWAIPIGWALADLIGYYCLKGMNLSFNQSLQLD